MARVLIGLVVFFNLQCAFVFLVTPDRYAGSFELSGLAGRMAVQAMGLLFVMWNVPYVVAITNPARQIISLIEACVMQGIGLVGESILLLSLPPGHLALTQTVQRFIGFDGAGLLLLLIALTLVFRSRRSWRL